MLEVGQSVFRVKVKDQDFSHLSPFVLEVEELKVESGGSLNFDLRNKQGEVSSYPSYALNTSPHLANMALGESYYAFSISDLDILLENCWVVLKEFLSLRLAEMTKEMNLFKLSGLDHLIAREIDLSRVISGLDILHYADPNGEGDVYLEIYYGVLFGSKIHFDLNFVTGQNLTEDEVESSWFDIEPSELENLNASVFNFCRYEFDEDCYYEDIDLLVYHNQKTTIRELDNPKNRFITHTFLPYSVGLKKEDIGACLENVREATLSQFRRSFLGLESLHNSISSFEKAHYGYINQIFFD